MHLALKITLITASQIKSNQPSLPYNSSCNPSRQGGTVETEARDPTEAHLSMMKQATSYRLDTKKYDNNKHKIIKHSINK